MPDVSISPEGERFPLPQSKEYEAEFTRLETLVDRARAEGLEIVVVMGVGFVGAVMAAIIADTQRVGGQPDKFVIGCQRPSTRSYWKIPVLNSGTSPVKAEDPEVQPMIERCVLEKKTLTATFNSDCLKLADCVVIDVQCDYTKRDLGNMRTGEVEIAGGPMVDGMLPTPVGVRCQGQHTGHEPPAVVRGRRREEAAVPTVVEDDEHANEHCASQNG